MLPFAKKPTALALTGITNDDVDLSADMLRTVTLPTLSHFGFGEGLALAIKKRGAPPLGGGLVLLTCPIVSWTGHYSFVLPVLNALSFPLLSLQVRELTPLHLVEEGYIRKVRGVAYSAKVSPQMANRVLTTAR